VRAAVVTAIAVLPIALAELLLNDLEPTIRLFVLLPVLAVSYVVLFALLWPNRHNLALLLRADQTTLVERTSMKENIETAAKYRMCVRCVMDTTDPKISFDESGVCNHCRNAELVLAQVGDRNGVGARHLQDLANLAKAQSAGRQYDVVIGLSGGVDSTYVAYLTVRKLGLRPLAVHFDNGWNSELAVHNIERVVRELGIDLYTHVIDWDEFRDLQLSFFKSHTSNLEAPTDHAIRALLYQVASKHGIRSIFSGGNAATELVLPAAWQHPPSDLKFLKAIHKRFGRIALKTFPKLGISSLVYFTFIRRIRVHRILDYVDYDKAAAIDIVSRELGWRPYPMKHGESIFTRFFQCHIQPVKFGIDKRRPHLSSLICSGQLGRQAALAELQKPLYDPDDLEVEIAYVVKKLGMARSEFEAYLHSPPILATDYPNQLRLHHLLRPIWHWVSST
jgi:N-acetyl sugar amidotransferase